MKIKCPECQEESNGETELYHHLKEKHSYMTFHILSKLLIKIHEKIEVYKNEHRGTISYAKLLAMKSLLEDEK